MELPRVGQKGVTETFLNLNHSLGHLRFIKQGQELSRVVQSCPGSLRVRVAINQTNTPNPNTPSSRDARTHLNKANRPTMRPQRFALCDGGGGRGGGGGSSCVAGG